MADSPTAIGVYNATLAPVMAQVLADRGDRALVFRGDDGLDELTTTTTSTIWAVHDSGVSRLVLDPAELGLARSRPGDLRGGDTARNAAVVRAVLGGQQGPVLDTVLLNAAAALAAHDGIRSGDAVIPALRDGCARAGEAVRSGADAPATPPRAQRTRWCPG